MGCKDAVKDFGDDVLGIDGDKTFGISNNAWDDAGDVLETGAKFAIDPVGKSMDYGMEYANRHDWVSDGAYDSYKGTVDTIKAAGMAVGGVLLAPVTGGASLGMTYGAVSGAGLGLMSGQSYNDAMSAGVTGGYYGAAGGAAGMALGSLAGGTAAGGASSLGTAGGNFGMSVAGTAGINAGVALGNAAQGAIIYGAGGYGAGRGVYGDTSQAGMFGVGSALGGGLAGLGGMGALGSMTGAFMGGQQLAGMVPPPEPGGGGISGGNYQAPTSGAAGEPASGGGGKATKKVPEAQFLDEPSGDWGNAGAGGVFGGLDNLKKSDKFFDTEAISKAQSQRAVGAFVK